MAPNEDSARIGRRTFVTGLAVAAPLFSVTYSVASPDDGGTGDDADASDGDDPTPPGDEAPDQSEPAGAPPVEWRRSYRGGEREYELSLRTVHGADDGGFVLAGDGAPVEKTGKQPDRFGLVKTGADGSREWLTFAKEGVEGGENEGTRDFVTEDLTRTADGTFVAVGHATYYETGESIREGTVATAVALAPDGTVAWTRRHSAFDEDAVETDPDGRPDYLPGALFRAVAPTPDGGVLAGGNRDGTDGEERRPWLVRIDAEGTVAWEREYDGFAFRSLRPHGDGGYRAVVDRGDTHHAVVLAEDGDVRETTTLQVDYERTPYNHEFTWTDDGGYAVTGRDRGQENMVLGKLGPEGAPAWRREYDGPYEADDWANQVLQTRDGGFVLGGYMRAAYDGDFAPTILRTDAEGTEVWRRLFTETDASDVADVVETEDGGYACLFSSDANVLVKLAPDADLGGGDGEAAEDGADHGNDGRLG
jgi:hypothetical protein